METEFDFGFGVDDEEVSSKSTRYKAKDGQNDLVSLAWLSVRVKDDKNPSGRWDDSVAYDAAGNLHPEATIRFAGCRRVYVKGAGYLQYTGPEMDSVIQGNKPKETYITVLVVWPQNSDEEIDWDKVRKNKGIQVYNWIFGDKEKYVNLSGIHKKYPLTTHDVMFRCPENGAEFQKLTFSNEPKCGLAQLREKAKTDPDFAAVLRRIMSRINDRIRDVEAEKGQRLTPQEIREKLGGGGASQRSSNAAKDAEDILDL